MKNFIQILLILFLFSTNNRLFSQTEPKDSLRDFLKETTVSEDKLDALIQLFKLSKNSDFDLAQIYGQKALGLAQNLGDKFNEANMYNKLGLLYSGNYDFEKGMNHYDHAVAIFQEIGDKEMEGVVYNNIGLTYGYQELLGQELNYHHKALDIFDKIQNKSRQAMSYINMGNVFIRKNDLDKSLAFQQKALKIYEDLQDYKPMATCLNNISLIYFNQGKYELSYKYFQKTLDVYEILDNKRGIAMILYNMASPLMKLKKYDEAEEALHRALGILESIKGLEGLAICHNNLGSLYFELKDYKRAEDYFVLSIQEARNTKQKALEIESYNGISAVYEATNNLKLALYYHKKYAQMHDSIVNTQIEAINEVEKKHAEEKNKKELELLSKENEIQSYQSKITVTIGVSFILILFIVLFALYKKYQNKNKSNKVLAEKNILIEEKNKEITDSINYAKRIQNAILPPEKIVREHLKESFIFYKPKDIVAGDFYWLEHKDGKVLFAVADCTGHGVPGAMVSVVCHNALNRSVREFDLIKPSEILNKTREIVVEEFEKSDDEVKDGMDIALCSLVQEGGSWKLEYAGANNPLWIIRNGELIETKADKQPIGKFDNPNPYMNHVFEIQKGDAIYVFSDGYVDQFGGDKGKKFKSNAFRELLLSFQEKSMVEQYEIINNTFETWKGDIEQVDDVCIIGVKV